jgi:hypothetical protein
VFFGTWLFLGLLLGACGMAPPREAAAPVPPALAAAAPLQPAALRRPTLPLLTGLSAADLLARFGQPDFRRSEPPAELWQYRSADCVLDVFLYGGGAGAQVVHSETRERDLTGTSAATCRGGVFIGRNRESRL